MTIIENVTDGPLVDLYNQIKPLFDRERQKVMDSYDENGDPKNEYDDDIGHIDDTDMSIGFECVPPIKIRYGKEYQYEEDPYFSFQIKVMQTRESVPWEWRRNEHGIPCDEDYCYTDLIEETSEIKVYHSDNYFVFDGFGDWTHKYSNYKRKAVQKNIALIRDMAVVEFKKIKDAIHRIHKEVLDSAIRTIEKYDLQYCTSSYTTARISYDSLDEIKDGLVRITVVEGEDDEQRDRLAVEDEVGFHFRNHNPRLYEEVMHYKQMIEQELKSRDDIYENQEYHQVIDEATRLSDMNPFTFTDYARDLDEDDLSSDELKFLEKGFHDVKNYKRNIKRDYKRYGELE